MELEDNGIGDVIEDEDQDQYELVLLFYGVCNLLPGNNITKQICVYEMWLVFFETTTLMV